MELAMLHLQLPKTDKPALSCFSVVFIFLSYLFKFLLVVTYLSCTHPTKLIAHVLMCGPRVFSFYIQ